MASLEDRIRAIEDRDAIRELTARYCQLAVAGRAEEIVALFTRDGIMESGGTRESGHARLLELYRSSFGELRPIPFIHNHVVELAGDRATGFCSIELRMVEEGVAVTAAGHYEDVLEREDDLWKFAHRTLLFYHRLPLEKGSA